MWSRTPTRRPLAVSVPRTETTVPLPLGPAKDGGRRAGARGRWAMLDAVPWPLVVILGAQAVLSLRLIWTNTAFLDEAIYLFAGHVEVAHWLHGSAGPQYATYFSGAPVLYPPLAALADIAAGLAGARMLSLVFMLSATVLLWSMAARLFGRWAAFLAAALFVALGPTQFLGAFATYDAMSLFLMAAAAWCVVAAQDRDDSSWLLLGATALLALANATKYASILFDPTIVALGGLVVARNRAIHSPAGRGGIKSAVGRGGIKSAVGRGGLIAACTLALDAGFLALGGPAYSTGLLYTTISRRAGTSPAMVILLDAAQWIGVACIPAAVAALVALARRHGRAEAAVVALLVVSGTLAPLDQARIHTTTSLTKHVDFGAWFAAVAAGYLIAQLARISRRRWAGAAVALVGSAAVLVPAAAAGREQSADFFKTWANTTQVTAQLKSIIRHHQGHYLTEDYDVPAYYLKNQVRWEQWSNTWFFAYRPPGGRRILTGRPAYQAAIQNHYFALVILNFSDTAKIDSAITADMRRAGAYHVIAELPYRDSFGVGQFFVWMYEPQAAAGGSVERQR